MLPQGLNLGPEIRTYIDKTSKALEIWVPLSVSHETKDWLRILLRSNDTPRLTENDLHVLQVRVWTCVEDLQRKFASRFQTLLGKKPSKESEIYIPDENGELGKKTANKIGLAADKLLVWSPDRMLANEEIQSSFENPTNVKQVGSAWLLNGNQKSNRPPVIERSINMKEKAERIAAAISQHGLIVSQNIPAAPDRICVFVKDVHGLVSMTKDVLEHNQYGQNYFKHQLAIDNAAHQIATIAGSDVHFFLEGWPHGEEAELHDAIYADIDSDIAKKMHEMHKMAAANSNAAKLLFGTIAKFLEEGNSNEAEKFMTTFRGINRVIHRITMSREAVSKHVHGFQTLKRIELAQIYDSESDIEKRAELHLKDYDHTHCFIMESIERHLPKGGTGIVDLGGLHFKTGAQFENLDDRENSSYHVENYIDRDSRLRNTHIMIFEPHHFIQAALKNHE